MIDLALWLAGAGHFVILVASAQVPARMGWRDDLAKLSPMNRKLMWTYGAFTVLTILAFGVLGWPRGRAFVVGHALLLGLFGALAGTYLGLLLWHGGGS
jgi:alginate O-acetyltransferase complex protein AlgI